MNLQILFTQKKTESQHQFVLFREVAELQNICTTSELNFVKQLIEKKQIQIHLNRLSQQIFLLQTEEKQSPAHTAEQIRIGSNIMLSVINKLDITSLWISSTYQQPEHLLAATEGLALGNYQFLKYFSEKKVNALKEICLSADAISPEDQKLLIATLEATYWARDMVNEPYSYLTAVKLSEEIFDKGQKAGFKVEVLDKRQIEALKMGGLLAVNKGSIDPPTFTILSYKPENAVNNNPIVLVGKGVVFDTGGLSLKPTPNSMDIMKVDMGGAAAVAGAFYAAAKAQLPVYLVGLIPATDNRPGQDAYAPGDVVKMFSGNTVEVLNTDAEGRMILADALAYAKKYKPELVIDLATLTGAAMRALGKEAIAAMRTCSNDIFQKLLQSGQNTFERMVELPLWDEYDDYIKSDIADMKNIGGADAGAITAGKFLQKFTDYPWIHLDIAGTAHVSSTFSYRGKNGTASGVRLLIDFIKNYSN